MAKDKTTFVVIQDWMFRLGLDLTETVIFAIIYGFSQDGESCFRGSWRYLEEHAICSRAKVSRALKHLVELGYVRKVDKFVGGIKFCEYYAEVGSGSGFAGGITEIPPVSKRNSVVSLGNEGGISAKPNNKDDNKNDNKAATRTRVEAASKKFNFEESLVAAGATAQHVDALMELRKKKRLTNTPKSYKQLIEAINTVCTRKGVTVDEVVAFMVGRKWGGLNPDWAALENLRSKAKRRGVTMSIDQLIEAELNANK